MTIEYAETSCAVISTGIAALPSGANPIAIVAGPQSTPAAIVVGPMPNRLESRFAVKAASSEPAAPTEKMMPITPAERPSSRTAKTRKITNARLEKRFEVAVHPACARRFGLSRTNRRPSFSSVQSDVLRPSTVARSGFSSGFRIPSRKSPEPTKLIASTSTAYGAVKISTSAPANPGPPTCAAERLSSSFEFPSMICSRSTSDGRYDMYATSKKTWNVPTRKTTA